MSNQQRPRLSAPMSFRHSSSSSLSAVLETPYVGGGSAMPPRVYVKRQSLPRKPLAPDQIWGHYNNYRSNGLVGSAIFHILALGAILGGATFGHQVVQQAKQREVVGDIREIFESFVGLDSVLMRRQWKQ
jgi:hypothetical protein